MTLSFLASETTVHERPPTAPSPTAPPVATGLLREWRLPLQVVRAVARAPKLARVPRGSGDRVIDIPGWKAPEASMAPIRAYLRMLGYDAQGWGLGVNTGDPERDAAILSERVATLFEETGEQTALVGWSLGGVIARETARSVPHAVSRVITYGTPAIGGPTYTVGADSYGQVESTRIRTAIEQLDRDNPIRVPITAIFTRRDSIVDWPACIDRVSTDVEHVEVRSTHTGMGIDPDVWEVVATRLAR